MSPTTRRANPTTWRASLPGRRARRSPHLGSPGAARPAPGFPSVQKEPGSWLRRAFDLEASSIASGIVAPTACFALKPVLSPGRRLTALFFKIHVNDVDPDSKKSPDRVYVDLQGERLAKPH